MPGKNSGLSQTWAIEPRYRPPGHRGKPQVSSNCRFLHKGITNDPQGGGRAEEERDVAGRRTSNVFVKATRRVERDAEYFLQTTGPSSGLLLGVCVICVVRMRRRFSVNFQHVAWIVQIGFE
jgi:hypothetical protein